MNTNKIKTYAPKARRDFIAAVTRRAGTFGLTVKGTSPVREEGQLVLIEGQPYPKSVGVQRQKLAERIKQHGFEQTMEAAAYTWFNRLIAIRFMELHGYLDHSFRVLSHPAGQVLPEILGHAEHLDLPGLDRERVIALKMDGNRDEDLYRDLLLAQCRALHRAMPFLFERVDDETELLLPDNLLQTDSLIRDLVSAIPEEDWQEVEIIGWLYQFYISEKKDQVIGKVVKSEDIPAATQLFTPNWIVQYLVQNSVGRLWLMANPASTLKAEWPYYIEPAEQSPEVQAQLDALIQTRMDEDGGSLNPETITVLDPACGSGHILVVAYDVLKAIYLERGYRPRDIPRLILEKNLYGLDIDDRAAQLAAFALVMKARADDRRLLDGPPKLNVLALQESKGLELDEVATHVTLFGLQRAPLKALLDTFEHAKTFGSLIQIPAGLNGQLAAMTAGLQQAMQDGDLYARQAAKDVLPLVWQSLVLRMQFDAVVANPPYMGGKWLAPILKSHLKVAFDGFEKDLFSAFMIRNLALSKETGQLGFMSPFVWMFISSYEDLRRRFIDQSILTTLIQLEYSGFDGATVPICTFTVNRAHVANYRTSFIRLTDFRGHEQQGPKTLEAIQDPKCGWFHLANPDAFKSIPGYPIAYWVSKAIRAAFSAGVPLRIIADPRKGMVTADNPRFIRIWHEVDIFSVGFDIASRRESSESGKKWFPYQKGGDYRKWFGNNEAVVNWETDGRELLGMKTEGYKVGSTNHNLEFIFKPAITWTKITSATQSFRYATAGYLYDDASGLCPAKDETKQFEVLGFLNSCVSAYLLKATNPTLNLNPGNLADLPIIGDFAEVKPIVSECVSIAERDWNASEISFDFTAPYYLVQEGSGLLERSWAIAQQESRVRIDRLIELETLNNQFFIQAYGLTEELTPEVPEDQITLARADREEDCQRLISYAIGCMMGRYSLDEPGLIYAHASNIGFDPARYQTFPADTDGIIPITETNWFDDDAPNRIREFLLVVWGTETLNENMAWLAESLGSKSGETPDETIRRYLSASFFKDHLQTYKRRPIYWCFSSGKQKAFEALVYLHRYHEGTLARMRMEYVVPLQGKMAARIDRLVDDIASASTTAQAKRLHKERDKLTRQLDELRRYDEQLRHYADQRIALDLDDGVKVNYGKFGDLLAEVKAVTGTSAESSSTD